VRLAVAGLRQTACPKSLEVRWIEFRIVHASRSAAAMVRSIRCWFDGYSALACSSESCSQDSR
jgi:hypothetical protein